jgi:UDP-arabinose 4-epimerase
MKSASSPATVLVVGGAGYVGSHCVKAFVRSGWRAIVFDNLSRGWADFVRWGPLIEGDILDPSALRAAIERVKPDAVAHFAALAYVGESVADPAAYYRTNVVGTLNLLDAMRDAGVSQLLFSSSCATYGSPVRLPIDESHPQAPINPYGASKLMAERILADYAAAYGLRYVALRYFNASGADPDGEVGERHVPETHVIPLALQGALKSGQVFEILGDDFDTRDGTAVRDYIHVADLADAHARAMAYLLGGGASDVFNLGTGVGTTVAEIAAAVERVTGRPLARRVGPRRAGDPACLVAWAEKARAVLGWTPRYPDIDVIMETAWRWHQRDMRGCADAAGQVPSFCAGASARATALIASGSDAGRCGPGA